MGIFCFDLNATVDRYPEQLGTIMRSLRADGHTVVVLTGAGNEPTPTDWRIEQVRQELSSLGCSDCYDQIVLVGSGPDGAVNDEVVARNKVDWMTYAGACALVDDKKANVNAAAAAGFMALRVK